MHVHLHCESSCSSRQSSSLEAFLRCSVDNCPTAQIQKYVKIMLCRVIWFSNQGTAIQIDTATISTRPCQGSQSQLANIYEIPKYPTSTKYPRIISVYIYMILLYYYSILYYMILYCIISYHMISYHIIYTYIRNIIYTYNYLSCIYIYIVDLQSLVMIWM